MRIAPTLGSVVFVAGCGAATASSPRTAAATDETSSVTLEPCSLRLEWTTSNERPTSRLPRELYARALAPVVASLCACSHGDDQARIDVRIVPSDGEVRASAPDDGRIDACLSEHLRPGHFARFDAPPGVDGAVTAPSRMAPAHPEPVQRFQAKMHAGIAQPPAAPPSVVLVYSLTLDRAHDELRDGGGSHVPSFEDR